MPISGISEEKGIKKMSENNLFGYENSRKWWNILNIQFSPFKGLLHSRENTHSLMLIPWEKKIKINCLHFHTFKWFLFLHWVAVFDLYKTFFKILNIACTFYKDNFTFVKQKQKKSPIKLLCFLSDVSLLNFYLFCETVSFMIKAL